MTSTIGFLEHNLDHILNYHKAEEERKLGSIRKEQRDSYQLLEKCIKDIRINISDIENKKLKSIKQEQQEFGSFWKKSQKILEPK